jgi:hypothetical protein
MAFGAGVCADVPPFVFGSQSGILRGPRRAMTEYEPHRIDKSWI